MTRLLIFKDPAAFSVLEVDFSAEEIVRKINLGKWEEILPDAEGPLYARQQGDVVVVTGSALAAAEDLPHLSPREQQVLVLLGEGLTTAQIAIRLQLSTRTIRGYVANMKKRLSAQNIQQLVARAVALGLFHPEV